MSTVAKWVLLVAIFVQCSCKYESRASAESNTLYASGINQANIDSINEVTIGEPISSVISKLGYPLWVSKLPEHKTIDTIAGVKQLNLETGSYWLYYSQQKDPRRDFIRVTFFIENGQVKEVENIWYHE